jgi:hypothetical protein
MPRSDTQWKPGQSGNPGGRPKRKLISEAVLAELERPVGRSGRTRAELLARKIVRLAIGGDVQAAKLVLAYTEGLPVQHLDVSTRALAKRLSTQTGAPEDWLLRRAEEIAAMVDDDW